LIKTWASVGNQLLQNCRLETLDRLHQKTMVWLPSGRVKRGAAVYRH
jgi:hypothetical protein